MKKFHYRLLAVLTLLVGLIASAGFAGRVDLTGRVLNADEEPIADAKVMIYTAGVKEGTSPYCPSCYADCAKWASTDADGAFKIEALDNELIFRILTVKDGFMPLFTRGVDPSKGDISVALEPIPEERMAPERTIRGRILDDMDEPIVGAEFSVKRVKTERGWTSRSDGVDPVSITNQKGEFVISADTEDKTIWGHISARGFAPVHTDEMSTGDDPVDIQPKRGFTVRGRIMHEGKPLPDVEVGVVQQDRNSISFHGEFNIGTRKDGTFELPNLPAGLAYVAYAKRKSIESKGASQTFKFTGAGEGKISDIGDINIVPGVVLAGKVVLSDGKPVPENTRLLISREDAWDTIIVDIAKDGSFRASDLATGPYAIELNIRDYHVSDKNYSLDTLNRSGLMGVITESNESLVILMEPGPVEYVDGSDSKAWEEAGKRWNELVESEIRGISSNDPLAEN
jgi:hypothetical protein